MKTVTLEVVSATIEGNEITLQVLEQPIPIPINILIIGRTIEEQQDRDMNCINLIKNLGLSGEQVVIYFLDRGNNDDTEIHVNDSITLIPIQEKWETFFDTNENEYDYIINDSLTVVALNQLTEQLDLNRLLKAGGKCYIQDIIDLSERSDPELKGTYFDYYKLPKVWKNGKEYPGYMIFQGDEGSPSIDYRDPVPPEQVEELNKIINTDALEYGKFSVFPFQDLSSHYGAPIKTSLSEFENNANLKDLEKKKKDIKDFPLKHTKHDTAQFHFPFYYVWSKI
tara:strand:- start:142 stop:987 length:846 start_codon:yes stop_codon:yes gene_type:complete